MLNDDLRIELLERFELADLPIYAIRADGSFAWCLLPTIEQIDQARQIAEEFRLER